MPCNLQGCRIEYTLDASIVFRKLASPYAFSGSSMTRSEAFNQITPSELTAVVPAAAVVVPLSQAPPTTTATSETSTSYPGTCLPENSRLVPVRNCAGLSSGKLCCCLLSFVAGRVEFCSYLPSWLSKTSNWHEEFLLFQRWVDFVC